MLSLSDRGPSMDAMLGLAPMSCMQAACPTLPKDIQKKAECPQPRSFAEYFAALIAVDLRRVVLQGPRKTVQK